MSLNISASIQHTPGSQGSGSNSDKEMNLLDRAATRLKFDLNLCLIFLCFGMIKTDVFCEGMELILWNTLA